MSRLEAPNVRSDFRAHLASTRGGGSLLEVDAWIPSEIKAISPLLQRLMRLIEGSHCITGDEYSVEVALREALSNAIVHGNKLNAHKSVHVRCHCTVGKGISLLVSDQGEGFDASTIPEPIAADVLEAEHGLGIHLMRWAMDQVSFQKGGTEVHMCKVPAHNATTGTRNNFSAR